MTYLGVAELLRAANHAALLEDGWVQGPRLRVTDDQLVNGHARFAAMTATDEPHEPAKVTAMTNSSTDDLGPRARWLREADEQMEIEQAVELVNGGTGTAVSRAAQVLARHQAAERVNGRRMDAHGGERAWMYEDEQGCRNGLYLRKQN